MRLLLFDNYDSFTYNLVHLVKKVAPEVEVEVHRNNEITLDEVAQYDRIILSPGPGIPSEAGLLLPLIERYAATKPILGVCLGHQAIGEVFGGTLVNLDAVYHGVALPMKVVGGEKAGVRRETEDVRSETADVKSGGQNLNLMPPVSSFPPQDSHADLFAGLPHEFSVGRYHSWIVSTNKFPACLEVTAVDDNGYIMALKHKLYNVQGVQFHPESVLTPNGENHHAQLAAELRVEKRKGEEERLAD